MNKGHAHREERTHLRDGKTTGLSVKRPRGRRETGVKKVTGDPLADKERNILVRPPIILIYSPGW